MRDWWSSVSIAIENFRQALGSLAVSAADKGLTQSVTCLGRGWGKTAQTERLTRQAETEGLHVQRSRPRVYRKRNTSRKAHRIRKAFIRRLARTFL